MNLQLDYAVLAPVMVPAVGAVLLLLVDVLLPRLGRWHWVLASVLLLAGAAAVVPGLLPGAGDRTTLCLRDTQCLYVADSLVNGLQVTVLVSAAAVCLLAFPVPAPRENAPVGAALVLASTAGAVGVAAARDLGSWLVLIELATLPTVALVALRARRSAVDGALSLLTTSLASFGVLALGAAFWFAATGSALLDADASLTAAADPALRRVLVLAVVLLVAGLAFKMSLVPFHAWTPEAYAGASVPVAGFLAVTSKLAALGALVVVARAVAPLGDGPLVAVGVLSVLSMTLGNLMALREKTPLRLLAWSTIAQAGWTVLPLSTVTTGGARAAGAYLVATSLATITAFAVVTLIAHAEGRSQVRSLAAFRGLFVRRPLAAATLSLALLSLAGLPPAVLGLVAKVTALGPVVAGDTWWLAVAAAVNAMLGVAVYVRWVLAMTGRPAETSVDDRASRVHTGVMLVGLLALVATSLGPQLLLGLVGG